MLKTKIVAAWLVVGNKLKVKRLTKFAQFYFFSSTTLPQYIYKCGERDRRTYPTHPIFFFGVIVGVSVAGDTPQEYVSAW